MGFLRSRAVDLHRTEQLFDVIPRTDLVIQHVELIECEISFRHRLIFPTRQIQLGEALIHKLLGFA